jgi:hypothetical protein
MKVGCIQENIVLGVDHYLSSTTQLACARLHSAATTPEGEPETSLVFTLIYRNGNN